MFDYSDDKLATETIEAAQAGYIDAALWLLTDMDGEHVDATVDDIYPGTLAEMREDVNEFLAACWGDVWDNFQVDLSGIEPEQIGHDFWLTRNGHGAGFWDRGLGEVGEALTKLSHVAGTYELWMDEDGVVYGG